MLVISFAVSFDACSCDFRNVELPLLLQNLGKKEERVSKRSSIRLDYQIGSNTSPVNYPGGKNNGLRSQGPL